MPTLTSALAMDGENYLHPEGPQLDRSLFSVAPSTMESSIYSSPGLWGSYSQQPGYSTRCPMQPGNQTSSVPGATTNSVDKQHTPIVDLSLLQLLGLMKSFG